MEPRHAVSWCSAAQRLLTGHRLTLPPGYLTVISAALPPVHMDPSGACSGVTSPAKPSTHRPSAEGVLVGGVVGFQVLGVCPPLTKLVFRHRWKKMLSMRRRQEEVFIPLIRARQARRDASGDNFAVDCYVDSLLGLRIPEDGGRNLTESEMVSLCSELLSGGPDSTVTALQWTMANLVAQPEIQAKLRAEIRHVVGAEARIQDEHLPRMPYLQAVVLEGLRRHPPGRFMLPHAATEGGGALRVGHLATNRTNKLISRESFIKATIPINPFSEVIA
ncbi:unnamed protein product [Miscanthus lutarioriparius]|uniref:Cytochrome P450 n=1 Tax=Miscanthus lutarioriparius TaxID=422564 RepID=A0A811RCM3_9POAL|nr:unnamed protein product [Miscanthus lutarioriparius]